MFLTLIGNYFIQKTILGLDVIEVARSDGSFRMTLISEDLDEPRAIAVFPQKG